MLQTIEDAAIGLVASQDVDRFFRDLTQIQTNLFIDACRRNNVLVMTPGFIYDFAHPTQGRFHMQMFRDAAQRAADYLEYQVRGRMVKGRHYRKERGMWAGRKIAPGYMVDMRRTLADGTPNPDWRKYRRFDPYADVTLAYFELFRHFNGCLAQTWRHIEAHGPHYPTLSADMIPDGFKVSDHLRRRSAITGGLSPAQSGLRTLLTNVVYLGHWIHQRAIVQWHNHEAIIPEDLFLFAFNRISQTDFHGDPNPHYTPYRPWTRHDKADRDEPSPTYSGAIFSDDLADRPHKKLASIWNTDAGKYQYQLTDSPKRSSIWNIRADILDEIVDELLLERLKATTIDEAAWQAALVSIDDGGHAEVRRLTLAIKEAEQTKDNLIASLGLLSNAEMVARAQARYEAAEREIETLKVQLAQLKNGHKKQVNLAQAKPVLQTVITRWHDVPRQERRSLFDCFAHHIAVSSKVQNARHTKRITVHWRDGSTSSADSVHRSRGQFWEQDDLQMLADMIRANVDQIDILRTFPDHTWRALTQRMRYHFGKGWSQSYSGERRYDKHTKWADTAEAKAAASVTTADGAQPASNVSCYDQYKSASCDVSGTSWPLQSGSPAKTDAASTGTPRPPR